MLTAVGCRFFLRERCSPRRLRLVPFSSQPSVSTSSIPPLAVRDAGKTSKPCFLANIFVGVFDQDVLTFPEPVEVQSKTRIENNSYALKELFTQIDSQPISATGKMKDKLKLLNQSGIRLWNDLQSAHGVEAKAVLKESELMYASELLAVNPSFALLLDIQLSLVAETILKHGTVQQKKDYVSKLLNGELLGAYALAENMNAYGPANINTEAHFNRKEGKWILNGQKFWVTNAEDADIMLVFAKHKAVDDIEKEDISVFLLEKGMPGVSMTKHEATGLIDCSFYAVELKDVIVEPDKIIGAPGNGYDIVVANTKTRKLYSIASMLGNIKQIFEDCVRFLKSRKAYGVRLVDTDLLKRKLGQTACSIYALESMCYLTSGLNDLYEIDTTEEYLAIQVFLKTQGYEILKNMMKFYASKNYEADFPPALLVEDIMCLNSLNKSDDVLLLVTAITGIQHTGKSLNKSISKLRNPLNFPGFVFRQMLRRKRVAEDNPKLNLHLYGNLHPCLKDSGEHLEYSVLRFQYAVETLLSNHGAEIVNRHCDLQRVAAVAVDIFAMTAVLSRASRSYCTGLANCDSEVNLAKAFTHDALRRIKLNITDILNGGIVSNDISQIKLGEHSISKGGYALEHPLNKNIT